MENAINEMKLQLNYVCYDKKLIPKLSGVWDAFFKLDEALKLSNNLKRTQFICPICTAITTNEYARFCWRCGHGLAE
jgi:hypothetical protein